MTNAEKTFYRKLAYYTDVVSMRDNAGVMHEARESLVGAVEAIVQERLATLQVTKPAPEPDGGLTCVNMGTRLHPQWCAEFSSVNDGKTIVGPGEKKGFFVRLVKDLGYTGAAFELPYTEQELRRLKNAIEFVLIPRTPAA